MNQIDELIQKAGTDCSGKWMSKEQAKILAELIIEDICELIRKNEYNSIPGKMHRMSAYAEEQMIKEYFGVEE